MQFCNWDKPGEGALLLLSTAGGLFCWDQGDPESRADHDTERSGFALITELEVQGALRLEDGADFFIGNRDL